MDIQQIRKLSENYKGGIRQLASDIGMTEANLHRCINKNKISAGDLEKIAHALGVPVSYFFDEEKPAEHYEAKDRGVAGKYIGKVEIMGENSETSSPMGDHDPATCKDSRQVEDKTKADLHKEIDHLNALLREKERTIQILLRKH